MSDDLDTAKLRDLLVKATPGPWRFRHRCAGNEGDPSPGHDEQIGLGWDWSDDNANIPQEPMRGVFALGADAALVMAARNELPALLDRIEALMAENFALAANQCKHGVSGERGDHICSRIEALEKAQAWQPIETAPKDAEILAFDPAVHMDCIVVEWWKGCWVDANGHERFPTHWMPLPAPPAPEPQK